jgi:hypothetical protein
MIIKYLWEHPSISGPKGRKLFHNLICGREEYSLAQQYVFKLFINVKFTNLSTYCCARLYSSVPVVIKHSRTDLVKII